MRDSKDEPPGGGRPAEAAEAERIRVREDLAALARPRRTGSPGAAEAESVLRARLEALGYEITEHPFSFSAWPGRFGLPALGALHLAGAVSAAWFMARGSPGAAASVLFLVAAAAWVAGVNARRMIERLPWGRMTATNWLAVRPGARPRFVVVAHRDTKSQVPSTLFRGLGLALAIGSWVLLFALALTGAVYAFRSPALTSVVVLLALVGGGTLLLCWAGNRSPGALDNASGLAALLAVARRERAADDVAFLITDAEELGLAGAYAMAPKLAGVKAVINLDGLDDHGPFRVLERFGLPKRGLAPWVAAGVLAAAEELGFEVERRDVPFGLSVDHIAFARAGYPAVTITRGTLRSLLRVHRPGDDVEHLSGDGAAAGAALVSRSLRALRSGPTVR